jgi:hypothetical protein
MGWVMRLGSTAPLQRRSIPAASACFSWTKEGMCYDSIALLLPITALSRLSPPPLPHTLIPSYLPCVSVSVWPFFRGTRATVSDVSCMVWVRVFGCWRLVAGQ